MTEAPLDEGWLAFDTETTSNPVLIVFIITALVSGVVLIGKWWPEDPVVPGAVDRDDRQMLDHHPG